MENLRLECLNYHPRDIFNIDETGLFWKLQPDRSLATKQTSGGKKSKDRITIALCANGDGSEKLNPWIIGRSKNPRCFKHVNRKNLRIIYRYNKSKWMTGIICEEWLQWFDRLMAGRKVLWRGGRRRARGASSPTYWRNWSSFKCYKGLSYKGMMAHGVYRHLINFQESFRC